MKQEEIIVILYPGCISFEVALAAEVLSEKYKIVTASPDGRDIEGITGLPLKTQVSYSQIDLEKCRAVLVPGGDPEVLMQNTAIDRVLIEANERKLLICGICAGPSGAAQQLDPTF